MKNNKIIFMAALLIASMTAAKAQIIISEVDPNGSSTGSANYNQDWFELENTGASAVDITGWKMDDNSSNFTADAVSLRGITSIAPGQSVVFIEDGTNPANDAALDATFITDWFGSDAPAGLTIANYGGSGVGLGSSGDQVNIFNSSGDVQAYVSFGATALGTTLDNTAGINGTISTFSSVGVNGAFTSANGLEVGSPGNVAPVPEPSTLAMMGLGATTLLAFRRFRSARR
jgi:hypothetical protein